MIALLALSLFLGAPTAVLRAAPLRASQAPAYYLFAIEVTGAHRLTPKQVIAQSGLKTGHTVTARDIEAAKDRLAESGLFTSVAYRTRLSGGGYSITVIFSVEEPAWQTPILFDNFVGLSDTQVRDAVAAALPTFDGFIPQSTPAFERVRSALEKLARDSGQPGTVNYLYVDDMVLGVRRYRFHLDRASGPVRVCRVVLETGVEGLREEMTALTASLVGSDYSLDYAIRHSMSNLLPVERRAGYLKARVREVAASREQTDTCDGVRVTVSLEDGVRYRLQSWTWTGTTQFAPADLDRMLGMTPGEPADGTKLDKGLRGITDAYRNTGYMFAAVRPSQTFDDAQATVACSFTIVEGAQFRMGKLQIAGLDPTLTEQVKALWQLREGEVFDASYPPRFMGSARAKLGAALKPFNKTDVRSSPDTKTLTVNVSVLFRSGS